MISEKLLALADSIKEFITSGAEVASEQLSDWGKYLEKVKETSKDLKSSQNATEHGAKEIDAEIEEQKNDDH